MNGLYKEHILELYRHPENYHTLENATHKRREHNPLCGDDLTLYLRVENDVIMDCTFTGSGCAISKASASLLTSALRGKTTQETISMGANAIQELIGISLSPVRLKCALLPLVAAQKALEAS